MRFDTFMKLIDYKRSYYGETHIEKLIMLSLYVDNILIAGTNIKGIDMLKSKINGEFEMKDMRGARKIIGIDIRKYMSKKYLFVTQRDYIHSTLKKYGMYEAKSDSTPIGAHSNLVSFNHLKLQKTRSISKDFHMQCYW